MNGSFVNFLAIIAGSIVGMVLRMGITEESRESVLKAMGLVTVFIGLKMAEAGTNSLILVVSMASGAIIGELLDIQGRLDRFGAWLTVSVGNRYGDVGRGFVTSSLIFCIGAMAIVGSLQEGLTGDASVLYTKSLIDGICAAVLAASLGVGVTFSSVPVLIYQGGMTLAASALTAVVNEAMLAEMSGTGGLLIMAIGLTLLKVVQIKLANLIPAILAAAIIAKLGIF